MNILAINATELPDSDSYRKMEAMMLEMMTSLPSDTVQSYSEAFSAIKRRPFAYDAIVTSFTPDERLRYEDISGLRGITRPSGHLPWHSSDYGTAYSALAQILSDNPFASTVLYTGAGDSTISHLLSRFEGRVECVSKTGGISHGYDGDRRNIQTGILRNVCEYRVSLSDKDTFVINQASSRSPFNYNSESEVHNMLVKPHFTNPTLFHANQVAEFEHLINKPNPNERDIHLFLESHPEMLLGNRYRTLRSHVQLMRTDEGKSDLIPDFILEPINPSDFWKIVDLKLPNEKIVSEVNMNRLGFSAKILAALRQLREYRDYFDNPQYRARLGEMGITAFKPEVGVIIGKDYGGLSFEEIIKAKLDFKDLEVLTYPELITRIRKMTWAP